MIHRAVLLMGLMAWSVAANAQDLRSALRGTVIGGDLRPVAGVELRIVSEATGETRLATSDAAGRFTVVHLAAGSYLIESEDDRYPQFLARVAVGINERVDVTLPVAASSISVSVDIRPIQVPVDRTTTSISTQLAGSFVAELPLDRRSFLNAVLLSPTMVSSAVGPFSAGSIGTGHLLNGFYNTEPVLGVAAVHPQIEALTGLEITPALYDAADGRTAGAQVHVLTRSGTNRLTGGAFAFAQTDVDRQQLGAFAGGPLATNRSFLYSDYQLTRVSDPQPNQDDAHDLSARLDHLFGASAKLTASYALTDGTMLDRRGQHAGASFVYLPSESTANDVRVSVSRVSFAPITDIGGIAESQAYQVTDTFTWTRGGHIIRTGGEWYGFSRGLDSDELAAQTWSGFVQDDWRATSSLSLSAGARVTRLSRTDVDVSSRTHVAPVAGFAWSRGADGSAVVVRGGYGRSYQHDAAFTSTPTLDQWSLGAERQWGRNRTLEAAYLGSRGTHLLIGEGRSRYHGLLVEVEQRSDTGLTAHAAYALGRWKAGLGTGPQVRHPLDARHKVTGGFTWSLPIGDQRAWLSKGIIGDILEDVQVAGVLGWVRGLRDVRRSYQELNLSLMKNWSAIDGRRLQVRFETFNVTDRSNPQVLFVADPMDVLFGPASLGRRYQVGARFLF